MSDDTPLPPSIQQINFNPDSIEIVWVEPSDIAIADRTGILNTRVRSIPVRYVDVELADLIESAVALLDRAGEAQRGAPQAYRR